MVEPRDEFSTDEDMVEEDAEVTDDLGSDSDDVVAQTSASGEENVVEDDFDDIASDEDLGFDTEEALAQIDESEDDLTEQLRGIVEWIVFQLIDDSSVAEITADKRGSSVRVQVRLPEEDLGKVIGRGGRIAKAIRAILMIVGSREHMRVSLDIEGRD